MYFTVSTKLKLVNQGLTALYNRPRSFCGIARPYINRTMSCHELTRAPSSPTVHCKRWQSSDKDTSGSKPPWQMGESVTEGFGIKEFFTQEGSKGREFMTNAGKFVGAVFACFGVWYGYQVYRWKSGKSVSSLLILPEDKTEYKRTPVPVTPSASIPKKVQHLLIGGGLASMSAANTITKNDPKAEVLMICDETIQPYRRPPLSKDMWYYTEQDNAKELLWQNNKGKMNHLEFLPMEAFKDITSDEPGVKVAIGQKVTSIDVENQKVSLQDGTEIAYDKCLIATGGTPKMPAYFEGAEEEVKSKTSVFRTVDDFFRLDHISRTAKSVAVIGGGFLGTELACGLGNRGKSSGCKVVQLLMEEGHFGGLLPEEMSKHCIDLVTSEGVEVRPSSTVTGVQYDKKENKVVLQLGNDEKVLVDHVVVAVGIQPNVELAESAELEVDPIRGGFMVNTEMEARSNLYVAGDAACYYDPKLGRRRVEHVVQAVISGNIAGNNMTGKKDSYKKQAYWWTDLGPKFGCQGIGLVSSKLNTFTFPFPNDDQSEPPAGNYLNGGKGVVLYMKGKRIVGVLSWNMSSESHMAEAEKVIRERKEYDETSLAEVAVRFRTLEDTWNLKAKNSEETTKDTKNEQKSQEKK